MANIGVRSMPCVRPERGRRSPGSQETSSGIQRPDDQTVTATAGNGRLVDEFELIRHCFRDRTTRRPGTVLGIGDDAAVLDTGGLPLVHVGATVAFSDRDDGAGTARCVFAAAFIRLAARAARPWWATLALTLDTRDPAWVESFSAAAAAACNACGVELVGGDTTHGPGRATVFALAAESALSRRTVSRPPTGTIEARWPLSPARAPEQAIADLVSVCVDLAVRGAEIRCDDAPGPSDGPRSGTLELVACTDAAGIDALHAVVGRLHAESRRLETDG